MKPVIQFVCNSIAVLGACLGNVRFLSKRSPTAAADTRPAHCRNIMTLLAHLCDMDDDLRLWILRWLAYPLRNPGAKMSRALIFSGPQGTGKSLFFTHVIKELYGTKAEKVRFSDLYSRSNRWALGANLVMTEGAFCRRDITRLKKLITAESILLELRGEEPRTIKNQLNFVFMYSREEFLPLDAADRRFVVVEAPPARPRAFYQAIAHEIADGGVDAFRDYLMHGLDMGDFDHSTPPPMQTSAHYADRRAA